jgi:hypothetical protein
MTTRKTLLTILGQIQNTTRNHNRDIMTFAGFSDTVEELTDYVMSQFNCLPDADKREVVAFTRTCVEA